MSTESWGIKLDQTGFYCSVKYVIILGSSDDCVSVFSTPRKPTIGRPTVSRSTVSELWTRPWGEGRKKMGSRWVSRRKTGSCLTADVCVDLKPLLMSVLYSPVTRPGRLFSAGANTTTRPSPSVLSTVITVVTFLIGWKHFFYCILIQIPLRLILLFGVDEESPDSQYVDLLLNPERFTGYRGPEAWQIWDSIYEENCFK